MTTVDAHLDWLRYTVPWLEAQTELVNLRGAMPDLPMFDFTGETVSIGQGYDHGMRLNSGMIFWHSTRHQQGISVQLSGQDLEELRKTTLSERDMLRYVRDAGGHATTIHGCLNIRDGNADVRALILAHEEGEIVARARSVGVYTSKTKQGEQWTQGDTFYLGSAKSAVQIRVYNKAAEQGIKADWTRIEIVWRGKHAEAAHSRMIQTDIARTIRGALRHQMTCYLPWWTLAIEGEYVPPIPIERQPSARYKWLRYSVLPALLSEIAAERRMKSGDIRRLFLEALRPSQGE